jgi:hypothetical protein
VKRRADDPGTAPALVVQVPALVFATTKDPVGELRRLQDLNRELLSAASGPQALSAVLWYLLTVNDADPAALEVVLEQPWDLPEQRH